MTDAAPSPPSGWYPDPYGRHEMRYWDGARWTEHVADGGAPKVDPVPSESYIPQVQVDPEQVRDQVVR